MYYGETATGRENMIVFWCMNDRCCYEGAPKPYPLQEVGIDTARCPNCHHPLRFVTYEAGKEESAARDVIEGRR